MAEKCNAQPLLAATSVAGKAGRGGVLKHRWAMWHQPPAPSATAVVGRIHSTFKVERDECFATPDVAHGEVFDYVEVFYNRQRRHSAQPSTSGRQMQFVHGQPVHRTGSGPGVGGSWPERTRS